MTMKHFSMLLATVLTLSLSLPVAAEDTDQPANVVITLNSGEGQVQGAALELAEHLAREDNQDVHVVLCGEAGELAVEQNIPPALEPRSISPKEILLDAIAADVRVHLCHLFLPNARIRQYDEDDLVDGVEQINPAGMAELILAPGTRVLGY
ncbi:MAG: DsrE family protein [Ectothiorhodospiraceae bacterium]|nr:DsrE family protein [Ectothiorhodospiraceae bacterium]